MSKPIHSIGCSVHTLQFFLNILNAYGINALVDVRSVPFSQHSPQFNASVLQKSLSEIGIFYLPFGKEFGARRSEPEVYTNGHVDFSKVSNHPNFQEGVRRINEGIKRNFSIAIMCTEKDPLNCHRFHLVTRELSRSLQLEVLHIDFNGNVETNKQLEKRMLETLKLSPTLEILASVQLNFAEKLNQFQDPTERDKAQQAYVQYYLLNNAYQIYAQKVAFSNQKEDNMHE